MRILLDENLPAVIAPALAADGHDVALVANLAPGIDDPAVLALARREDRVLLTFDGDFGDLIFRDGAAPARAVLLFRLHPIAVAEVQRLALDALPRLRDGVFAVASRESFRTRLLPNQVQRNDGR